jgi:hypothetical protein
VRVTDEELEFIDKKRGEVTRSAYVKYWAIYSQLISISDDDDDALKEAMLLHNLLYRGGKNEK